MTKKMKPVTINYTEFANLLKAERVTIHDLVPFFKRDEMDFDEHGNIFIGFNEDTQRLPILVAHTDNVLEGEREPVFDLNRRCISGRDTGIGFDDKAGIIAIISLWRYFKEQRFRIILPADEEVGGVGSHAMDYFWYTDAKWILELDRKGDKDFIQTSGGTRLCSDEFAKKFEEMGFKKATGVFTDVNVMKPNADWINMANLSIGYYNPHTDKEYLDTIVFEKIVNKVAEFIAADYDFEDDKPDPVPDFKPAQSKFAGYNGGKDCVNCGGSCEGTYIYNRWGERFCSRACMEDYDDRWESDYSNY